MARRHDLCADGEGWLYLRSSWTGSHARSCWAIARPSPELTIEARKWRWVAGPAHGLIHHSDRGSQYQQDYRRV